MPADICEGIVEVKTCSKKRVNEYLERGYRLLGVAQEAFWAKTPKGIGNPDGYVIRLLVFVVGRTEGVEPYCHREADEQKAEGQ